MISNLQSTFLASDEVLPELFLIDYFKLSKAVRLTQAHGFMQEKRILRKKEKDKKNANILEQKEKNCKAY